MKPYILTLLVLTCFNVLAQETANDSVVYLKVIAKGDKSGNNVQKVKTKGEELASTFEGGIKSRVCLVDEVAQGKLESVKLYFNNGLINLAKQSLKVKYKDTELKLLIYDIDSNGNPGRLFTQKDIRFIVGETHKGAIELDLTSLNIRVPNKFFIGIELLEETTEFTPIALKIVANKDGVTLDKSSTNSEWHNYTFPSQIKLELKIAQ